MALGTPTERLVNGSGTDGTVYTTASFTPPANALLLLFVASGHSSAATEPTIGGTLGLAWTKIDGQVITGGTIRGTLWWAKTTGSPPTGTLSFTHGSTHSSCMWHVVSISGADLTTPIKQHGTPFQTTTTDNPGITLASAVTAGNLTMGFNAWNRTFVLPVGSGYTQTSGQASSQASPTIISSVEHKMAGAQLVDWTTTDDIAKVLFAIEVNAQGVSAASVTPAAETEAVQAAGRLKSRTATAATETDSVVTLIRRKAKTLTSSLEADAGVTLSRVKRRTLTPAAETDSAVVVTGGTTGPTIIARTITPATETDTVPTLVRVKKKTAAVATSADTAQLLARMKRRTPSPAAETETGTAVARRKARGLLVAAESETAAGLTRTRRRAVTAAAETDQARPVTPRRARTLEPALETDLAAALLRDIDALPQPVLVWTGTEWIPTDDDWIPTGTVTTPTGEGPVLVWSGSRWIPDPWQAYLPA